VPDYIKSKSVAEETAWEFVKKHNNPFELVCVHPTLVLGPILSGRLPDSMKTLVAMMNGEFPFVPNLHWSIVDVRDVAQAIQKALKAPNANGNRYMLSGENLWFIDMAHV
ncbi:NAD-dependent epimerase/dehydratase, partial [Reticulomyxa filosa]